MNLEVMEEGAVEREIQLFSLIVSSDIHTEIIRCQPRDVKLERLGRRSKKGRKLTLPFMRMVAFDIRTGCVFLRGVLK